MEHLKYCNLGLVFGMAEPNYHSFVNLRKVLCDPFFSAVEIRDLWSYSETEREELKRMLAISLMKVTYETQPLLLYEPDYNLNTPDQTLRQSTIRRLKEEVDAAAFLQAHSIVTTSGKYLKCVSEEEQLAYLRESLLELSAYAQEKNLLLLLEPFDRSIDKKMLIGPLSSTLQIVEQVHRQYPNFGLLLDCGRFPLFPESMEEIIHTFGEYILQVHIGNCVLAEESVAFGDKHPRFGISHSLVDVHYLAGFLKALFDVGFLSPGSKKIMSLEARPVEGEEPELIIANLKRFFLQAWQMVMKPCSRK